MGLLQRQYDVFNLSSDLTWPPHSGVIQIYAWELRAVCHHHYKSCEHKHRDSGGIMVLIFHVTSREHMFKVLYEFMGGTPHDESPSCHVWWPLVYRKWGYEVFNMSRDLTKSRD